MITASKFEQSWLQSASPNSIDRGLQVHLQTSWITPSMCISKIIRLPPSSSYNSGLRVHLQTRSIMVSKRIYMFIALWCGETVELERRQPIIDNAPHLTCFPKGEFVRKNSSSLCSIRRWREDIKGYPAMMNHTNWVDLWTLGKSPWRCTQIVWIYETSASAHETKSWER
jgi:hypothetical protein